MPNKYPEEIKKQVVQFYKDGRPVSEISKELQIPFGTPNGLIFHSDRGGQYISGAFTKLLRNRGVQQSFSASGKPCDNAMAETFFATFKKEEAYRRTYSSEQDYRKSVEQYIEFYNKKRPHRSLAYKTPAHFEELFGKK